MIRYWLRLVRAEVRHVLAVHLGYRLRPYDSSADRRRWFWQQRMHCGLGALPPAVAEAVVVAAEELMEREASDGS